LGVNHIVGVPLTKMHFTEAMIDTCVQSHLLHPPA